MQYFQSKLVPFAAASVIVLATLNCNVTPTVTTNNGDSTTYSGSATSFAAMF